MGEIYTKNLSWIFEVKWTVLAALKQRQNLNAACSALC